MSLPPLGIIRSTLEVPFNVSEDLVPRIVFSSSPTGPSAFLSSNQYFLQNKNTYNDQERYYSLERNIERRE